MFGFLGDMWNDPLKREQMLKYLQGLGGGLATPMPPGMGIGQQIGQGFAGGAMALNRTRNEQQDRERQKKLDDLRAQQEERANKQVENTEKWREKQDAFDKARFAYQQREDAISRGDKLAAEKFDQEYKTASLALKKYAADNKQSTPQIEIWRNPANGQSMQVDMNQQEMVQKAMDAGFQQMKIPDEQTFIQKYVSSRKGMFDSPQQIKDLETQGAELYKQHYGKYMNTQQEAQPTAQPPQAAQIDAEKQKGIQQEIANLKAQGVPADQIKKMLQEAGIDPAMFGL